MASVVKERPSKLEDKSVTYIPIGGTEEIDLTYDYVRTFLVHPTKSGMYPEPAHIIKFMMLCKAERLNPWVGDAFLVGYDAYEDGKSKPVFNLITAASAFLKRAELNEQFDGIESGVIVVQKKADGPQEERYRQGSFCLEGEVVVGGWARTYRKDKKVPFYSAVNLSAYSSGRSRWAKDGPGMIEKVARVQSLRAGFPNQLSGFYTREESETIGSLPPMDNTTENPKVKTLKQALLSHEGQPLPLVKPVFTEYMEAVGNCTDSERSVGIRADVHADQELSEDQRESLLEMLDRKFGAIG